MSACYQRRLVDAIRLLTGNFAVYKFSYRAQSLDIRVTDQLLLKDRNGDLLVCHQHTLELHVLRSHVVQQR